MNILLIGLAHPRRRAMNRPPIMPINATPKPAAVAIVSLVINVLKDGEDDGDIMVGMEFGFELVMSGFELVD